MNGIDVRPGEVQLWWASLEIAEPEINRLRQILTPAELRRADRFRIAAATRRFIGARAALRMILGRATGVAPSDVEFLYGEHGKPRLPGGELFFNASDSGDYVVVALTSAEVGVDIELARRVDRLDRLAQRVCTNRELDLLARTPREERDTMILRLWTCKEAGLKATGIGLSGGATNIEAEIPTNGPPRLVRILDETDHWSLLFPDLTPGLLCTVIVKGENFRAVSRPFSTHST